MKNMKTMKKSMRVLITILISLLCINGALFIATIIATAAVTPAAAAEETNGAAKVAATKVSDAMAKSVEAKLEKHKKDVAASKEAVSKKTTTHATTTVAKNTSKETTTAPKSTTTKKSTTTTTTTKKTTTATSTSATSSTSGISTLRGSVNRSLMNAFDELKFVIKVNPNSTYLGYFSTSRHSLEMRSISVSTFRHEMGHFLDVLKNMPSRSSEFASIYSKEKSKYSGTNAAYITKNAQEYFAQSYRNYLENSGKLKAERPQTYAFVVKQISNITGTDINRTYNKYSWSW